MLERLDSSLAGSIQGLYNQARTIFDYCWREGRVKELLES
jgi:hypothetical protein